METLYSPSTQITGQPAIAHSVLIVKQIADSIGQPRTSIICRNHPLATLVTIRDSVLDWRTAKFKQSPHLDTGWQIAIRIINLAIQLQPIVTLSSELQQPLALQQQLMESRLDLLTKTATLFVASRLSSIDGQMEDINYINFLSADTLSELDSWARNHHERLYSLQSWAHRLLLSTDLLLQSVSIEQRTGHPYPRIVA